MQKLRTERGITLIALIITIIVMLILVGVSVTVALNGGLFTTAKDATNKTQLEIDKEQLLELALGAIDNKGNVDPSKITADGRFTYADGVYTSESGNRFTVDKWGSVALAYELSGIWQFNEEPSRIDDGENSELVQNIEFTGIGFSVLTEVDLSMDFKRICVVSSYDDDALELKELEIYFDGTQAYDYADWGWEGEDFEHLDYVDFGSTPQAVSQEFYEWFTANATKK